MDTGEKKETKETKEENLTMPKFAKHKVDICKQKFQSYFINHLKNLPLLKSKPEHTAKFHMVLEVVLKENQ